MAKIALKRKNTGGKGDDKFPEPLPEAKYRMKISNTQEASEVFGDVGKQYGGIALDLTVVQGDYTGQMRTLWVFPASDAIRSLVEVLGGDPDDEEADINFEELNGLEVNVYLGQRKKKGSDRVLNSIKRFAPAPKR